MALCTQAQLDAGTHINTDFGCIPNDPVGFVAQFYGIGLGMIGMVGLLFFIIGGYHIMVSHGDPQKLRVGRSYITYAIIGILLAIFGFVFMQLIIVDVLHIPGFSG